MRKAIIIGTIGVLGVTVAGCAGLRTERQGRDAGRAICDMKKATSTDSFNKALNKYNKSVDKAQRITGRPVGDDVQDIQNNINDLQKHATDGNKQLAQQDVAAIQRNVAKVASQAPDIVARYYQGMQEGLNDCTG
jgi:hypothetical protein